MSLWVTSCWGHCGGDILQGTRPPQEGTTLPKAQHTVRELLREKQRETGLGSGSLGSCCPVPLVHTCLSSTRHRRASLWAMLPGGRTAMTGTTRAGNQATQAPPNHTHLHAQPRTPSGSCFRIPGLSETATNQKHKCVLWSISHNSPVPCVSHHPGKGEPEPLHCSRWGGGG